MRRAAKKDGNQAEVVAMFRAAGATVHVLNEAGAPDLLVGFRGQNLLVEVKDGKKPPSERRLTAAQVAWHRGWRGQVVVLERVEQVGTILSRVMGGGRVE